MDNFDKTPLGASLKEPSRSVLYPRLLHAQSFDRSQDGYATSLGGRRTSMHSFNAGAPMRKANVYYNNRILAGVLTEQEKAISYVFEYDPLYQGPPISLTMPLTQRIYFFEKFPPYFEGVLPEGHHLEALLSICKLPREDLFSQLMQVGQGLVGAFTVEEII